MLIAMTNLDYLAWFLVAVILGGTILSNVVIYWLEYRSEKNDDRLNALCVAIYYQHHTPYDPTRPLIFINATLQDDLRTTIETETASGVLDLTDDQMVFYDMDQVARFTIAPHQLREYGIVRRNRWPHWSSLPTVILCGEAEDGWHVYRLSLWRWGWRRLKNRLAAIYQLPPRHYALLDPVVTLAYRQNMLGHWEQTEVTKLFLLANQLLMDWQPFIALDQLVEVVVLPSLGNNVARLSLKYRNTAGELTTAGFDMPVNVARQWAVALHQRSGVALTVTRDRKKKA